MPTYQYEAAYAGGQKVTGVVEAVSREAAVAQVRQSCEVVLSLREVPKTAAAGDPLERFQRIDGKSLSLTCRQFSIILKSGLPLVQAVDLVAGQTENKPLSQLLRQVSQDISNGWGLSYSLEQRGSKKLPVTFRETIRAGEESGDLVSAFRRMGDYYDRTSKTRAKAISAMTYPAFVIFVAVIVVGVVMGYAIPSFTGTFASLGVELPWVTRFLIAVSGFFSGNILLILCLLAAGILGLVAYGGTEKGGLALSRFLLTVPVAGEIVRMAGASQFAHTMSAMLTAGMPILQAIEVSGRAVSSLCISQDILGSIAGVEGGRSLGDCLLEARELPPMLVQMTQVGEASGSLETTLEVLAEYYDNEVEQKTARAVALLEPTIICILAVMVVMILLAVYLPMFGMYSAI